MRNNVYEIPIRVKVHEKKSVEAIVNCYVSAPNHLIGLKAAITQLSKDGYLFIDLISEIREIHPDKWQEILNQNWKEARDYLPDGYNITRNFEESDIVYGPFIGYEDE